jgi:hypothetical protein
MDILENYHNSKLHYRMLRDVALNVELEFNKMNTQLFESDIQRYMDDFLRSNLKNTDCYPHREACHKTDLVVFKTHDDGGKKQKKGIIFYEIKTVFKNHESFSHNNFVEKIRKDFCKLKDIKLYKTKLTSLHFYYVNSSAYDAMLEWEEYVKTNNVWIPIDLWPDRKNIRTVSCTPFIALQEESYSNIEKRIRDYTSQMKKSEEIIGSVINDSICEPFQNFSTVA